MINAVLGFLAEDESAPEYAFVASTASWFKSSSTGLLKAALAWWSVEPASGFLWYCHLFFFVKPHPARSNCFDYLNPRAGVEDMITGFYSLLIIDRFNHAGGCR